jgi:dihydropteroate synthase
MEYHEAADFLFDLRRYPSGKGIEPTRALLAQLGDPQEAVDCVQVAGSNGKGSTARMLERTLREAGLDVGLYTSPHLTDVRERIRIDGRKVRKGAVTEFVEAIEGYATEAAARGESPTFFETTTALALWAFARQNVDVAVLEVGIGGRYDATSVVDPVASAVTSVSLEHTDMLGDTVEEIARDKAAVAGDRPLVTAATGDALTAVREAAGEVVTVGREGTDVLARYDGRDGVDGRVELAGPDWQVTTRIPMLGAHQALNAGVAASLARQVADVDERTLVRGLQGAGWPGRFEVMGREPLVVLDGAHNPGSCESAAATLAEFDYDELHLVFGVMSDKDKHGMAEALPTPDRAYLCRADTDRAEVPAVLARLFEDRAGTVHRGTDVPGAVDAALSAAGPADCVLVCGSLSVVGEARERWTRRPIPKRLDSADQARAALTDADVSPGTAERFAGHGAFRALRARVRPRQADVLEGEMHALGGSCAVADVADRTEYVDVLLMGTLAQHRSLFGRLEAGPYGLPQLARDLRRALDERTGEGAAVPAEFPWADGTAVMGVLNITPDSFHDGGEYNSLDAARERAREMVAAGVDILDVGGESTRPGAEPVPVEEEKRRVVPIVEALSDLEAMLSVDTRKAAVAEAALDAGADIVNDVSGLEDPAMRRLIAERDVPTVVMHSINAPVDPDADTEYDDVVEDVIAELGERVLLAETAGLDRSRVVVDPGLGFGKSRHESFELLDRLGELRALGCPVMVGHSHKSMFELVGADAGDAPAATIAATALAADRGADIVRVHDVPENVRAVRTALAMNDPDRV